MRVTTPKRVTRTFTQRLAAAPARVFPLLCPVRERDWLADWDPALVISRSGVAEPDCVFLTDASPGDAIWYITRHEASRGFVEMIKIIPTVVATRLTIALRATDEGSKAIITYTHTSLGPAGDDLVASFTEEHYQNFMHDWETRLDHYLTHGTMLGGDAARGAP